MAQDTSLSGLRNQIVTSIFGRRLGLAPGNSSDVAINYLTGSHAFREQVEGWSAAGSSIISSAYNLAPYGISVVGCSGASATTTYTLSNPVPGVTKKIFNVTTGYGVVSLASGSFLVSTGSAASTQAQITFVGKGAYVELIGLTTVFWGLTENLAITSVTTGNLMQIS